MRLREESAAIAGSDGSPLALVFRQAGDREAGELAHGKVDPRRSGRCPRGAFGGSAGLA